MDIKAVQERLIALGYDVGPAGADGIEGRATRAAVAKFQADRGVDVKWPGTIGPKTIAALNDEKTGTAPIIVDKDSKILPPWFVEARRKLGLHEKRDNKTLREYLKSDGSTLGDPAVLPWCFAGDVEILTSEGWQRLDALTADKVWQVAEDGSASLTGYFPVEKDYDGDAFRVSGSTTNLLCDVEHRWWGCTGSKTRARLRRDPEFVTLDQLKSEGLAISAPYTSATGIALSEDEITMIAAFMSDGCVHHGKLSFQVSRERKVAILTSLSPQHVYQHQKVYGRSVTPLTVLTFDVPTFFDFAFSAYKVLSNDFINGLSREQARTFLRAYSKFDGHTRDDGRLTLYTSDEGIRDNLISIAYLAGYWPMVGPGGSSDLTKKPSWRIGIMPTEGARRRIRKGDIVREHFKGKMYCVTVPQSRIIVRGSDLQPVVTGNCGDFMETVIALTLPAEPMVTNPYYALNWMKFGVPINIVALGAIAPFERRDSKGKLLGGHIAQIVGHDKDFFHCLGGNQSNAITITKIAKNRLSGPLRWPSTYPLPNEALPLTSLDATISTNEV